MLTTPSELKCYSWLSQRFTFLIFFSFYLFEDSFALSFPSPSSLFSLGHPCPQALPVSSISHCQLDCSPGNCQVNLSIFKTALHPFLQHPNPALLHLINTPLATQPSSREMLDSLQKPPSLSPSRSNQTLSSFICFLNTFHLSPSFPTHCHSLGSGSHYFLFQSLQ